MTILVPIMLYGWVPLTVFFFFNLSSRKAVLYSVVGGVLFLPMATYDLPGIPSYGKYTTIALGILLGEVLSNQKKENSLQMRIYDLPMMLWCFAVPVITSLSNGLGLYDGFSSLLNNYLLWGVFYWAGRRYFTSSEGLREISLAIIAGGLLYVPLILFEVRMSPQLSNIVYGFFPHSFLQHIRYGHYRPIVFMQHGLMVALWMAASFTISFWKWRSKEITHIKNIPLVYIVITLFFMVILCRSANGWTYAFLGIATWVVFARFKTLKHLKLMVLFIPAYMFLRATNIVPIKTIELYLSGIFDPERIASLAYRLNQENLFSQKALQNFLFGWGGYNRGRPIDPLTGEMIKIVDSLWIIIYSTNGFAGLVSFMAAMLMGPWTQFKTSFNEIILEKYSLDAIILSLIVVFFMIDSLLNGMINPVYTLTAGALVSYYIEIEENN